MYKTFARGYLNYIFVVDSLAVLNYVRLNIASIFSNLFISIFLILSFFRLLQCFVPIQAVAMFLSIANPPLNLWCAAERYRVFKVPFNVLFYISLI